MLLVALVAFLVFVAVLLSSARQSSPEPVDEDWFVDEYLPLDPDLDGRIDN